MGTWWKCFLMGEGGVISPCGRVSDSLVWGFSLFLVVIFILKLLLVEHVSIYSIFIPNTIILVESVILFIYVYSSNNTE